MTLLKMYLNFVICVTCKGEESSFSEVSPCVFGVCFRNSALGRSVGRRLFGSMRDFIRICEESDMSEEAETTMNMELAAHIVSAYVSNNTVPAADLPALIGEVHATLERIARGDDEQVVEQVKPAVAVKRSISPDYIICLEDGKKFKSLKRHLRTQYNLTPEQYREKWGLPPDYPMVAPNYALARSALARQMGLGQRRRED